MSALAWALAGASSAGWAVTLGLASYWRSRWRPERAARVAAEELFHEAHAKAWGLEAELANARLELECAQDELGSPRWRYGLAKPLPERGELYGALTHSREPARVPRFSTFAAIGRRL